MDIIMIDQPSAQLAMRGGLAWPDRAPEPLSHGVAFFNRFRDLTATGFWSSRMGVEDLQYIGNRFVGRWRGCPEEQLRKLGLLDREP